MSPADIVWWNGFMAGVAVACASVLVIGLIIEFAERPGQSDPPDAL